jgi:hypothetical protein
MSTAAIPVHIALVDESNAITADDLTACAGALNEQIQADFAPIWKVAATVGAYPVAPAGTWAVIVKEQLDQPGALGYHTDSNNQPVSYIELTQDWTVTASHETMEMLADPWGNRMHSAILPWAMEIDYVAFGLSTQHSRVHYLLEVADPCEAVKYSVGGVDMSDFLLPYWYRTELVGCNEHYSHAGGCIHPRQVADGGYVSFCNDAGEWFQVFNDAGAMSIQDLGKFSRAEFGSLREFADHHAREFRGHKVG